MGGSNVDYPNPSLAAAIEITEQQIEVAKRIVHDRLNSMDKNIIAAVTQVLATNHAAILTSNR